MAVQAPRSSRPAAPDPVFVDHSGRRRRLFKLIGVALAVALTSTLGAFVAGLVGMAPAGLPGWPNDGRKAQPAVTPAPSTARTGAGQEPPGGLPGTSANATPTVGASPTPSPTRTNNGRRPTSRPTPPHPSKTT
jgi:hypothetical protein